MMQSAESIRSIQHGWKVSVALLVFAFAFFANSNIYASGAAITVEVRGQDGAVIRNHYTNTVGIHALLPQKRHAIWTRDDDSPIPTNVEYDGVWPKAPQALHAYHEETPPILVHLTHLETGWTTADLIPPNASKIRLEVQQSGQYLVQCLTHVQIDREGTIDSGIEAVEYVTPPYLGPVPSGGQDEYGVWECASFHGVYTQRFPNPESTGEPWSKPWIDRYVYSVTKRYTYETVAATLTHVRPNEEDRAFVALLVDADSLGRMAAALAEVATESVEVPPHVSDAVVTNLMSATIDESLRKTVPYAAKYAGYSTAIASAGLANFVYIGITAPDDLFEPATLGRIAASTGMAGAAFVVAASVAPAGAVAVVVIGICVVGDILLDSIIAAYNMQELKEHAATAFYDDVCMQVDLSRDDGIRSVKLCFLGLLPKETSLSTHPTASSIAMPASSVQYLSPHDKCLTLFPSEQPITLSSGAVISSICLSVGSSRSLQIEQKLKDLIECEPRSASSTALVIDTSGSMKGEDRTGKTKIDAAREAAIDLVNMLRSGSSSTSSHEVAVVAFSTSARTVIPITSDYDAAIAEINTMSADGNTNVHQGMVLANGQLQNAAGKPIIILLSDGMPTAGPGGDSEGRKQAVLAGPVKEASERGYCIYVVGFGEPSEGNIDQDFLNAIVQAAGCDDGFYTATEAVQLHAAYVEMRYNSMGWNLIRRLTDAVQQGEEKDVGEISIPPSQQALHATLVWPGSQLDLILEDPQGKPINVGYPGATIDVYDNMVYTIVSDPLSGTWKASVYGRDIPLGSTKFAFLASVEPAEEEPEEPPAEEPEFGMLRFHSTGPIDLTIKDPEGRVVGKQTPPVEGIEYVEQFDSAAGATIDEVMIPSRMVGDYQIRVITEPGAERLQRFSVSVTDGFETVTLASRKFIIHAPKEPYVIRCTEEGFHDATGLPEEPKPEKKPNNGVGPSPLTIILIAVGGVALIGGILGLLYFLRSRYYI